MLYGCGLRIEWSGGNRFSIIDQQGGIVFFGEDLRGSCRSYAINEDQIINIDSGRDLRKKKRKKTAFDFFGVQDMYCLDVVPKTRNINIRAALEFFLGAEAKKIIIGGNRRAHSDVGGGPGQQTTRSCTKTIQSNTGDNRWRRRF